ncbi:MAG: hypothetical protein HQL03_12620 [Nitrospirae bacterium]|nr:hypothetical protein [Nitrospirota bacterium]
MPFKRLITFILYSVCRYKDGSLQSNVNEFFKDARRSGLWPDNPKYLWHNMNVYAIDGSKYTLPSTKEIRDEFDPKSGLDKDGKGYYPKCTVSTLYDEITCGKNSSKK